MGLSKSVTSKRAGTSSPGNLALGDLALLFNSLNFTSSSNRHRNHTVDGLSSALELFVEFDSDSSEAQAPTSLESAYRPPREFLCVNFIHGTFRSCIVLGCRLEIYCLTTVSFSVTHKGEQIPLLVPLPRSLPFKVFYQWLGSISLLLCLI